MKKIRIFNNILIIIGFIVNTIYLVGSLIGKLNANILVCLSLYIIMILPRILRRFIKINLAIESVWLVFIFLAQLLGSVMKFYSYIYWYDSFMHLMSGILTAFLAIVMLNWFKKYDRKELFFNIIYIIAVTLMIAAAWEIFEFTADKLLGGDAQKAIATGVTDTMKDIICALLGSILVVIFYLYEIINKKSLLVNKLLSILI